MRLLTKLVFLLILCLISSTAFAQTEGVSLDERGYGLYIPSSYDADGEDDVPLLIALHGFGDTWGNFYPATGLTRVAENENFIVAFPQGYLRQWNDGSQGDHYEDDVRLLRDLITRIDRDYRIDLDRIYLVGFSNGGTMVYHAACEAPELFAGIAAIAGTMRTGTNRSCSNETQLPVFIIHGTADSVVAFDGDAYRVPVVDGALLWAENNGCNTDDVPEFSESHFQNGFANYLYEDCPDGNFVGLHVLQDINHSYPGASAYVRGLIPEQEHQHTAQLIWDFFEMSYQAHLATDITPEATELSDG